MKKFSSIFMALLIIYSSITYAFCADLGRAWDDFNKNNYTSSVPVFEELCNREKNELACIGLGLAYRDGKGKQIDLGKAIEYLSQAQNNTLAQSFLAQLYEYKLGDIDSLNKAYSLYDNIRKSSDQDLAKSADEAFIRLPIYKFIVEFTDHLADLRNDRISYETFCNLTNNMNMSELPPEVSSAFLAYLPMIQESNKDGLTAFIGGFLNPFQEAYIVW